MLSGSGPFVRLLQRNLIFLCFALFLLLPLSLFFLFLFLGVTQGNHAAQFRDILVPLVVL